MSVALRSAHVEPKAPCTSQEHDASTCRLGRKDNERTQSEVRKCEVRDEGTDKQSKKQAQRQAPLLAKSGERTKRFEVSKDELRRKQRETKEEARAEVAGWQLKDELRKQKQREREEETRAEVAGWLLTKMSWGDESRGRRGRGESRSRWTAAVG